VSGPLTCADCSAPITRQSKTGRCRVCANRWMTKQPGFEERRRAGIRWGMMEHPERKEAMRARLREVAQLPHATEARRARALEMRLWEKGHACIPAGSEARKRGGRRRSETVMAWCPAELRQTYRELVYRKKLRAAEAKEIILEQHEKDMREFRRSIAQCP